MNKELQGRNLGQSLELKCGQNTRVPTTAHQARSRDHQQPTAPWDSLAAPGAKPTHKIASESFLQR